jgi:dTDP-4-amino-4,6-dideoxygalactose transaminase
MLAKPIIPLFKVFVNPNVKEKIYSTLMSGWTGEGPRVIEFENKLSEITKNKNVSALSAGTHGLTLAIRIIDEKRKILRGGSIITSALTCFATSTPILENGADIIWADINKDDLNISPESIKEKIRDDTKAIIVIHWGGNPCRMNEIYEISKETGIPVIEDGAHAFGSFYVGHPIGECSHSDFCMISFQAIKSLNCGGDGGALFYRNKEDCEEGKLLRWFYIDRNSNRKDLRCEEDILRFGYKMQMNDVTATIGLSNLETVWANIKIAQDNADFYRKNLNNISGITLLYESKENISSRWIFTILVDDLPGFARKMGEKGIMVSQVHARNDKHACVKKFRTYLPNLESIIHKHVSIPVGWWVTAEDREYILSSIQSGW